MMINRHSIFFKLNLLFALALIILILLFGFFLHKSSLHEQRFQNQRAMELFRLLEQSSAKNAAQRETQLFKSNFIIIDPSLLSFDTLKKRKHPHRDFILYRSDTNYYFKLNVQESVFFVKDNQKHKTSNSENIIFFLLLLGLISLYVTLKKSLLPLKTLTKKIRHFADGDFTIDTTSRRQDEIALIANEFNDAVVKIGQLESSRQLFLRNIMHELKTPLTKGKLTLALMKNSDKVDYLDSLFNRMDHLINQFARIEKIQSSSLAKEFHSTISLIEDAIEKLYLSQDLDELIQITILADAEIFVDAELFVSALSNLIDNAIKYTTSLPINIEINKDNISISNQAAILPQPIENYCEAFIGENHANGGLGLGLYIVDTILKAHDFSLEYQFNDEVHTFCVHFS